MGQETNAQESMAEMLARAGIVVTDEGRARARRRLAEARARRDPAKLDELRRQFGGRPRLHASVGGDQVIPIDQ